MLLATTVQPFNYNGLPVANAAEHLPWKASPAEARLEAPVLNLLRGMFNTDGACRKSQGMHGVSVYHHGGKLCKKQKCLVAALL